MAACLYLKCLDIFKIPMLVAAALVVPLTHLGTIVVILALNVHDAVRVAAPADFVALDAPELVILRRVGLHSEVATCKICIC